MLMREKNTTVLRMVSLFLMLILSLSYPALAINEDLRENNSTYDTTCYTQRQYEQELERQQRAASNEERIQSVIKTFMFVLHASSRDSSEYSIDFLIDPDCLYSDNIQYRISQNKCFELLFRAQDSCVQYDSLMLDNCSISVVGDRAEATIDEDYTYFDNTISGLSNYGRQCKFSLVYKDNQWLIQSFTTTDPCESQEGFIYSPFDYEKRVNGILSSSKPSLSAAKQERRGWKSSDGNGTRTLYKWDYDAAAAVAYATAHYNDTSSTYFTYNTSVNCQNFASQCVWAGLGGDTSNLTAYPAIYDSIYGSTNDRLWQNGNYYSNSTIYYNMQWAWDNVCGFARLIHDSNIYVEGPYGWLHFNTLNYADVGDVIWIEYEGDPYYTSTYVNLDHAMVVLEVSGAGYSRDISDITRVAAHTLHSYANESLSAYLTRLIPQDSDVSSTYFAVARIRGGHYSSPQP